MKKTLAIIMSINLLLVCLGVYGESTTFSVRGGISFESSKEYIMDYEKSQGNEMTEHTKAEYWYTTNCIQYQSIKFAGYENTSVVYYFNNNNELESILYTPMHFVKDKASADAQYNTFNNALEKYGSPIASGDKYIQFNEEAHDAIHYFSDEVFHHYSSGKGGTTKIESDIITSAQRLFPLENGYVDIMLIEFREHDDVTWTGVGSFSDDLYHVVVSYTFVTEEQVQKVKDANLELQNAIENDL